MFREAVVYIPTFFTSQPQPQVAGAAPADDLPDLVRPNRDAALLAQAQVQPYRQVARQT